MALNRRDFLKLGGAGMALGAASPLVSNPFFSRSLQAAMLGTPAKKMIVFFLRGGMDGANVLIPSGDPDYNDTVDSRPTLYIAPEDAIDLSPGFSNTFAHLAPELQKMIDDVPSTDLALIHRVAYTGQSRSHFNSQQYWENAIPGSLAEEGWVNRLIQTETDLDALNLPAASVSFSFQANFRGPRALAHIPNLDIYNIGDEDYDLKLVGAAPNNDSGSGLLGIYGRDADNFTYDELVRGNGLSMAASLDEIADNNVDPGSYSPGGGATYPSSSAPGEFVNDGGAWNFFRQLRDSVQLLKETDCRVCGIELGGFDTHSNQASQNRLPRLLRIIAHAFSSAYLDLDAAGLWDDTTVVMISEFGRTSKENGSVGTDHGEASTMFVAGGNINGGVYNCDASTWSAGDLFSTSNGRYIAQNTDFRAVVAELMTDHFGVDPLNIDDIIPNWSTLSGSVYDELGLM